MNLSKHARLGSIDKKKIKENMIAYTTTRTSGDMEKAFMSLVPLIHSVIKLSIGKYDLLDYDDFVSEASIKILSVMDNIDIEGNITAYVHSCIRNHLMTYLSGFPKREVFYLGRGPDYSIAPTGHYYEMTRFLEDIQLISYKKATKHIRFKSKMDLCKYLIFCIVYERPISLAQAKLFGAKDKADLAYYTKYCEILCRYTLYEVRLEHSKDLPRSWSYQMIHSHDIHAELDDVYESW